MLYGHKARVWDAQFLGQFIISIGEDAACILWDTDSNLIKKFKGHQGSNSVLLLCYCHEQNNFTLTLSFASDFT